MRFSWVSLPLRGGIREKQSELLIKAALFTGMLFQGASFLAAVFTRALVPFLSQADRVVCRVFSLPDQSEVVRDLCSKYF
jgi:hypothetical protein